MACNGDGRPGAWGHPPKAWRSVWPGFGAHRIPGVKAPTIQITINKIAKTAYSISAACHFCKEIGANPVQCVRLGIVLAQPPGYPQKKAGTVFCPRSHDNGRRVRCTGLARAQVPATPQEKAVVHNSGRLLLLRLCIYRQHKKKTEGQLGAQRSVVVPIFRRGLRAFEVAEWMQRTALQRKNAADGGARAVRAMEKKGPRGLSTRGRGAGRPPGGPQTGGG